MPQVLTNSRDRSTYKNLDNLDLINFKLSKELRTEFESHHNETKETSEEIEKTLKNIDDQQAGIRRMNRQINVKKQEIKDLKQRMGLAKPLAFVRPAYWNLKRELRIFKKLKKEKCKNIALQYTRLQNLKRKMKERRIQRKTLSKNLKEIVEKRHFEIDFVKQYEKSKRKLQQSRSPKDIEIIEKAVNMIKENDGKWPENIQDEEGKSISATDLHNILNGNISVNELKEKETEGQEQGQGRVREAEGTENNERETSDFAKGIRANSDTLRRLEERTSAMSKQTGTVGKALNAIRGTIQSGENPEVGEQTSKENHEEDVEIGE